MNYSGSYFSNIVPGLRPGRPLASSEPVPTRQFVFPLPKQTYPPTRPFLLSNPIIHNLLRSLSKNYEDRNKKKIKNIKIFIITFMICLKKHKFKTHTKLRGTKCDECTDHGQKNDRRKSDIVCKNFPTSTFASTNPPTRHRPNTDTTRRPGTNQGIHLGKK